MLCNWKTFISPFLCVGPRLMKFLDPAMFSFRLFFRRDSFLNLFFGKFLTNRLLKKPCHISPNFCWHLILVKTFVLILDFCQALFKSKSQTLQFPDIKKFSQGFMKSSIQFLCDSSILLMKSFFILEMISYFEHNFFVTIFSLLKKYW